MGKVLVVDDEPISLRITKKLLTQNNFDVLTASSAATAMKELAKSKFDIVIIDITMPGISGFDLIQLMQSFEYNIPVIFLSNSDNKWTIEEAHNIGGKRFVSKEREFNHLPEIVKEVLATAS
jgi:DNA-binding response OmpR family regulator